MLGLFFWPSNAFNPPQRKTKMLTRGSSVSRDLTSNSHCSPPSFHLGPLLSVPFFKYNLPQGLCSSVPRSASPFPWHTQGSGSFPRPLQLHTTMAANQWGFPSESTYEEYTLNPQSFSVSFPGLFSLSTSMFIYYLCPHKMLATYL